MLVKKYYKIEQFGNIYTTFGVQIAVDAEEKIPHKTA